MGEKREPIDLVDSGGSLFLFAAGLLTICALASIGNAMGGSSVAAAAGFVALLVLLCMGIRPLAVVIELGFSLLGAIASVPAAIALVSPSQCSAVEPFNPILRITMVVLVIVLAVLGGITGTLFGRFQVKRIGLGLFGAIEILSFLVMPSGIDVLGLDRLSAGWIVILGIVVSALIGFLLTIEPQIILFAASATITVSVLILENSGISCGDSGSASNGTLVTGIVTYVVLVGIGCLMFGRLFNRR